MIPIIIIFDFVGGLFLPTLSINSFCYFIMETFTLSAQRRTELGKGANRRLRRAGYVPAIMYGGDKEPVPLTLVFNDLNKQLEREAFYSRVLTVVVDELSERAVLKDLQRHPSRPLITHLDLQRVSDTKKLHMRVPLHFINADKCAGVKQSGGVVSHHMTEVEIRCLPKDLPEYISIDLQDIDLNEIIHLSKLTLPDGVTLVASHEDSPVVSVHLPRGTQSDEDEREDDEAVQEEETEEQETSKK